VTTCRRRQGRRHRRAHAQEARGRAPEAAARKQQPAGAVPVGHPARRLPLRRRAPGSHCRQRTRRRLRDALGLRHEAGPVRAVAGGRLAAGGRVGQGRHRCRQGAVQGAAAGLGVRWPHRRAHARGLVEPVAPDLCTAQQPAGVRPPVLRRDRAGQRCGARAEGRHRGLQERRDALWTLDGEGADRQHHQQAAPDRPRRGRRPVQGGGTGRSRLPGPGDLVARRRVLGRRQPRSR
jgi:hypothetical protein